MSDLTSRLAAALQDRYRRDRALGQGGHTIGAVKSCGFVVDAWQHGDSGVHPCVQQAPAGLARLAGAPRR